VAGVQRQVPCVSWASVGRACRRHVIVGIAVQAVDDHGVTFMAVLSPAETGTA
jgi:hypothetical protein